MLDLKLIIYEDTIGFFLGLPPNFYPRSVVTDCKRNWLKFNEGWIWILLINLLQLYALKKNIFATQAVGYKGGPVFLSTG